jgi:hypothetical protein
MGSLMVFAPIVPVWWRFTIIQGPPMECSRMFKRQAFEMKNEKCKMKNVKCRGAAQSEIQNLLALYLTSVHDSSGVAAL